MSDIDGESIELVIERCKSSTLKKKAYLELGRMREELYVLRQFAGGLTQRAPDALRAYDMGEVAGVKLTYVKGNVFATPAKRR